MMTKKKLLHGLKISTIELRSLSKISLQNLKEKSCYIAKNTRSKSCSKLDKELATKKFLKDLDLYEIDGYIFQKKLGGGSSLNCLYKKGEKKVVVKFLIAPRNKAELERFKQEASVLEYNHINAIPDFDSYYTRIDRILIPENSYPLPVLAHKYTYLGNGLINYFSYEYLEGTLLCDLATENYTLEQKITLLHRIASGLSYFNRLGYEHRDIHPENIIIKDNYSMPNLNLDWQKKNEPGVVFLDMGSCQKSNFYQHEAFSFERDVDEDLVFRDNNRRLLSSFVTMAPDFLQKGEKTKNYDSWSFGVYAYKLIFNEYPFDAKQIEDVNLLVNSRNFPDSFKKNLDQLEPGLKYILNHLLSPNGDERPEIYVIVRLISWLRFNNTRFQDPVFIKKVIHNQGLDPYENPIDRFY